MGRERFPIPVGGEAINVVLTFFMALLSFVDSTPRAYRLKASNAAPPISTFAGAISPMPEQGVRRKFSTQLNRELFQRGRQFRRKNREFRRPKSKSSWIRF
jgi:hypothetical protein